ncbi:MAG: hypothetical protein LBL94_08290 [Prevotellaceae bacterium]|jgi:hypothetical protein|nr:hypothetical protein [Prevotellaceae bacterium]
MKKENKGKTKEKAACRYGLRCMALLAIFCVSSCQEWGLSDPPAGNQVYPKLEQVLNLTFDEELDPEVIQLFAYLNGSEPALVEDEERGQVFHTQGGYARMDNPLNKVKVQNAVSLTMWVKQAAPAEGQGLTGSLFSFLDTEGKGLSFTANGELRYTGPEGAYEDNNPTPEAELMPAGGWHYLAIAITNTGYFVHVDSTKVIDKTVTDFDMLQAVQSIAALPYFYIAYGADAQPTGEIWVDDLKIYRNTISTKETSMPEVGGEKNTTIIVGETDCSTGWWTAFSDFMSVPGDGVFRYKFRNYTAGTNNWENWVLVVTNGKDRDEAGYAEYFVLRADAFGWGDHYSGDNIAHTYNWDTFTEDMKGAMVDLTLKREGGRVEMNAVVTKAGGGVMTYSYFVEGIPAGAIGTFLTVEKGYLEMDAKDISLGTLYSKGSYRTGNGDFSTGWWQAFSNIVKTNGDYVVSYQFYNHTNKEANWNNWVLVVTNGKDREESDYAEHFVLRADSYGWGTYYIGENLGNTYDWGTFAEDMDGALVDLTVKVIGTRLDMIATTTTASGKMLEYTYYHDDIPTGAMGTFLTLEGCYIDIISVSTCPFINK